jgi:hypothetical protein
MMIHCPDVRTWIVLDLLDLRLHGGMGLKDVGAMLHRMLHLRAHLAHIGVWKMVEEDQCEFSLYLFLLPRFR